MTTVYSDAIPPFRSVAGSQRAGLAFHTSITSWTVRLLCLGALSVQWNCERKGASHSRALALDPDPTTVQLHKVLRQGETETGASVGPGI